MARSRNTIQMMKTVTTIVETRELLDALRKTGARIGFIPTMGALHDGHLSLVRLAKQHADFLVLSSYVNPIQFNSLSDFELYPRTVEEDQGRSADAGVDLFFHPSTEEMYPVGDDGERERCKVKAGSRSLGLCGASRPGHFDGVCTVVTLLFNIVRPDVAVFGEKDFQQLRVIEEMVHDVHSPVTILGAPTIRDSDGLALSSRNLRLTAEDRFHALYISKSLFHAKEVVAKGERNPERVRKMVIENLERSKGLRVDYVELVHAETLRSAQSFDTPVQLLVAAFIRDVRLIDNIRLLG